MSADSQAATEDADVAALREEVAELRATVEDLREDDDGKTKLSLIATKGSLDMAYPPLILASTAAAFDWDVTVFHTFWGLDILHKKKSKNLKLSAVGNTSMPLPNILAVLPFMDTVATNMMAGKIEKNNVSTIEELIETSMDLGVEFQACQMTIDLMGYEEDDFIDGVTTGVGAASALAEMADADIQLFV